MFFPLSFLLFNLISMVHFITSRPTDQLVNISLCDEILQKECCWRRRLVKMSIFPHFVTLQSRTWMYLIEISIERKGRHGLVKSLKNVPCICIQPPVIRYLYIKSFSVRAHLFHIESTCWVPWWTFPSTCETLCDTADKPQNTTTTLKHGGGSSMLRSFFVNQKNWSVI